MRSSHSKAFNECDFANDSRFVFMQIDEAKTYLEDLSRFQSIVIERLYGLQFR
jgi:hypothetical protein